ncbi:MAG TPA: ABC transporter substrate-binding protein [Longimicrobium sp.]|jgi:branched-chain amino acid transport system substrate-binding protein
MRLKTTAGFLASLSALPLLLGACGGEQETIVLGVAGPMKETNGISVRNAAQMAVDEINRKGGIDGRSIELLILDDEKSEKRGIEVARDLRANERVVAVIGHVNSAVSVKAATIYNSVSDSVPGEPVVEISPASSAPALTGAGPWTFRVTPTDLEFSPALARHARTRLGSSKAAVLYANDEYGQGVTSTFEAAFREQGGQIVSTDPYLPAVIKNPQSLDAYLVRAIRRGADALVIGGQADAGVTIIQAARRLGFSGPIMGSDGLTGVKDAGAVGEGVFVSSAFLADSQEPRAREFVAEYRRRFSKSPDHRAAQTYDVVYLLRDAIEKAGAGRAAIRAQLEKVRGDQAHQGVSGIIQFDENGDVERKPVLIGVVRGGELVTAR